jgi:hypothetical protein
MSHEALWLIVVLAAPSWVCAAAVQRQIRLMLVAHAMQRRGNVILGPVKRSVLA